VHCILGLMKITNTYKKKKIKFLVYYSSISMFTDDKN
jgi:hypothetical protein